MNVLLFAILGFAMGSLPFALWLGKLGAGADIRNVGDGNPGAANAWRAGGWKIGLLALVADTAKGALPVALARAIGGLWGWSLLPVSLAPLVGHAFSPWLRFRGGKAIAPTFGVWSALTYWEVPTALGLSFALLRSVQAVDAWTVALALPLVGLYLVLRGAEPWLLATWGGTGALLLLTHRRALRDRPRLRTRRKNR